MPEQPEVSVVIPTRNRWPLLSTLALPSALGQEGVELEVVVVDDGSTDDSAERLAALGDARARVVRRERSGGMSAARNAGIAAARGEWVAFLDDDDLWSPVKLRTQIDAAHTARAEFAYCGAVAVDDRLRVLGGLYLPPADELAARLLHACVIPAGCSNVIVRSDLLRETGGFDEHLRHVADWDLWLRISDRAGVACDEVLVAYVLHAENMHAVDDSAQELDYLVRKHARLEPARVIVPDLLGYSRWSAAQRSRVGRHGASARMYLRNAVTHRSPGDLIRAVDALVGKRLSAAARRLRPEAASTLATPETPAWLEREIA